MSNIMVSVCVLSYNHEKYLRDCLEGIVMQRTTFPIEAWVHDDASTDKSQEIIKEYQQRYPEIIKPILQTENQYSKKKGSILAMHLYPKCTGKYVALCEGDDYWTDPYKLQKQVDFMESHQDYSICFHEVQLYNEQTKQFEKKSLVPDKPGTTTIQDLAKGNYIHTVSVLLRYDRTVADKIIGMGSVIPGDYVTWMLYAENGKIFKLEDAMAVYRLGSGIWSGGRGIGNDLSMLITLTKLWGLLPQVREELWGQICQFRQYMLDEDNKKSKQFEQVSNSKAYRIGKCLLKPFKWKRK